jgi:hypothetical protein
MATHFSGPVVSDAGFQGAISGAVTGAVTGNVTGNITGLQTMPAATAYTGADAPTLAISPGIGYASMTKASPGAYTLAAPGASNVGKRLVIIVGDAKAVGHARLVPPRGARIKPPAATGSARPAPSPPRPARPRPAPARRVARRHAAPCAYPGVLRRVGRWHASRRW